MNNVFGFRIGIFYKDRRWAENKAKALMLDIPSSYVEKFYQTFNELKIYLRDGSSIRFIGTNSGASRGLVFDRVFYQDGIDENVVKQIITPQWRPLRPMVLR